MPDHAIFEILPILGRKIDVPADDISLFVPAGDSIMTHDVGGVNFDIGRKRGTCTKSKGSEQWSNTATAQATKTLGLFELYDGTNRDHLIWDNGKFYLYDSARDPGDKTAAGVTHATTYPYSIIKVGDYVVWADRETGDVPYKWKNADAAATTLVPAASPGDDYKFRCLANFQRRVIGAYSNQSNGNIDLRWSTAWPTTAITSLNFPAANQLYIPNDDNVAGLKTLGRDRCFVYCENSIIQLVYYPDYTLPFKMFVVVPSHGTVNQQSIVTVMGTHYFFCPDYGFCTYQGGREIVPISDDIEDDVQSINSDFYNLMTGTFVPLTREIVWNVPMNWSTTPTHLLFYNVITGQWRIEDKSVRYVDSWRMYDAYTWNNLVTDVTAAQGSATWNDVIAWKGAGVTWADLTNMSQRLVYSNTDGQLYYHSGDDIDGGNLDANRIEPIIDFGDKYRIDLLQEIWMDFDRVGSFSVDLYHRSGDTIGEVLAQDWTSLGSISCNSPSEPKLSVDKNARLHQIKWGTDLKNERFQVSRIRFHYIPGGRW
jgi:hypothetical protein